MGRGRSRPRGGGGGEDFRDSGQEEFGVDAVEELLPACLVEDVFEGVLQQDNWTGVVWNCGSLRGQWEFVVLQRN